ncbi:MAG: ATP-binding protein [Anaerolineales bacterium]|nr:ATP-binding protein [Chloroflexota bacterium]MBL6980674.1 ATP-binding protein [Anaerolineales bacterium]
MINRPYYLKRLTEATRRSPITALLGPRQCGKTTLAHLFSEERQATFFDLESFPDQRRLENPELVLGSLEGLVILDEIQIMPELFQVLRVLVDRPNNQARFLILGSASPAIIKSASESLAGRVEFIELSGFDLSESGEQAWERLWLQGGFPRTYLAETEDDSLAWREGFIRTFLERDIPQLGINIPAITMRRFWTMLAHYHGQTWNASELGRSMGLSDKTVRSYLDILSGTFMVRQLQPWFENLGKRQVKSPKIYLRDSGLLHSLLDIPNHHTLLGHPKIGASWEGYVIEQILQIVRPTQAYFWATHSGAEVDLVFYHQGKKYGVEVKFSEAPKITASMRTALMDLKLEHLWILYPGQHAYPVDVRISVWPLKDIARLPIFD